VLGVETLGKTIFLRYMNSFSLLCLLLSIGELIHLLVRFCKEYRRKQMEKILSTEKIRPSAEPSQQEPHPDVPVRDDLVREQQVTKPHTQQPSNGTKSPPSAQTQQVARTTKTSNVFDDTAAGKLSVEQERYNLRQENKKDRFKKRRSSRSTRFVIPVGTQSLNRPKKMLEPQYQPMFEMVKLPFSQSERENDDTDGSLYSGEAQLGSVSQNFVEEA